TVKKSGGFIRIWLGECGSAARPERGCPFLESAKLEKSSHHATLSARNNAPARNRRASRTAFRGTVREAVRFAMVLATRAVRSTARSARPRGAAAACAL